MLSTLELSPQTLDAEAPVRIAVKNLDFYYGEHKALKNINLDFRDRHVTALIGPGLPLVRIVTEGAAKVPPAAAPALKLNPALPATVRMQDALRPDLVIEGGARLTPDRTLDFTGFDLTRPWLVNGGTGARDGKPLFSVKRGTPIVMAIDNRTAFVQPLHVHGHAFRLLHPLDDGWENYFLDTVQIPEGKKRHIAFIADNPGRWLISSTVLERFDLGLWSWFEVV